MLYPVLPILSVALSMLMAMLCYAKNGDMIPLCWGIFEMNPLFQFGTQPYEEMHLESLWIRSISKDVNPVA